MGTNRGKPCRGKRRLRRTLEERGDVACAIKRLHGERSHLRLQGFATHARKKYMTTVLSTRNETYRMFRAPGYRISMCWSSTLQKRDAREHAKSRRDGNLGRCGLAGRRRMVPSEMGARVA
jgi:hypothetical protein